MKKALWSAGFSILGLAVTWIALRIGGSIDWRGLTYQWPEGRCWELDHCDVPWYGVTLFFGVLLLPTAVHAFAGWRLAAGGVAVRAASLNAVGLFVGTCVFFVVARLVGGVP